MKDTLDTIDRNILRILQQDGRLSAEQVADRANLSRNACWRRIKRLEESGIIKDRVALVAPEAIALGLSVIILIRTSNHDPKWLHQFRDAVLALPQILGVHRMSGDLDYVLRARVKDVKAYDALYQDLIKRVPLGDVSASFVMEDIKDTHILPV